MKTDITNILFLLKGLQLLIMAEEDKDYTRNKLGQFAEKADGAVGSVLDKDSLRSGMNAPDIVQDVAYGAAKGVGKGVIQVANTEPGRAVAKAYLNHQNNLKNFKSLEDAGYTEWVGQMGRLGAAGVEVGYAATQMGALIVLPAAIGGAASLRVMAPALQVAMEKKMVMQGVKSLDKDVASELGVQPSKAFESYVVGATVGGALNDGVRQIEKMDVKGISSKKDGKKIMELIDETWATAEESEKVISDMRKAAEESGLMEELSKIPPDQIDAKVVAAAMKKTYEKMPPDTVTKLKQLGSQAIDTISK